MTEQQINYRDIADYFIALSNVTGNLVSNLKLQKLMYYAQAWHLALYGHRLFDGEFEAWIHGPVLPVLYRDYKQFGWKPIEREDLNDASVKHLENKFGEKLLSFLSEIVEEYFGLTAYELERLTHKEEPWQRARRGFSADEPCHRIIADEWMKKYYKQFISQEA
ncbi:MAG: hypothetical protein C7B43_20775 [Sulfobacillus benefaciens]|uniref:Antitoxin SocA-like Panacea domain-containing protein n=1 Tax=Sulfobacillus benefaciens TaxID=453960 RepID=A0A2T2WJI0_9FIRM|nr:MAG: hypothetical protein C7B43_20775 [Sulfobacillus benefaciens]